MHVLNCVLLIITITPVVYTKCFLKPCDVPSSDNSREGSNENHMCNFCEYQLHNFTKLLVMPKGLAELKFVDCRFGAFKKGIVYPEDRVRMLWVENSVEFIEDQAFKGYTEAHFISFTKNNNISILPDFVFQGLLNLDKVDFSWNRIVKIGENVFTGVPSITDLNLAHNRIESFCIKRLVNLKIINLEYNLITVLSEIPKNLYEAYFGFNRLTKIGTSTFHNMELLERLELQWNNITEIESGAFFGLQRLQYVDFSFNNLTISSNVIDGPELRTMDFTGNQIMEFNGETVARFRSINLILRQNKITNVSYKCDYAYCFTLHMRLDLSQNSIEQLEKLKFNVEMLITSWDLSRNKIKTVPIGFFYRYHTMVALNLSTNAITQLNIGSFFGIELLEHLDLSHNRIEYLNETIFLDTPQLETLNLTNNHIRTLNGYKVIGMTHLNLIELDGNQFSCPNLDNLIEQFRSERVEVVAGSSREVDNINGIKCKNPPVISIMTKEIAGEHCISTVGIVTISAIILCIFAIIFILTYVIYFKRVRQPVAAREDELLL